MRDLFTQIRAAVTGRAYYLALFPALTLPDICGAMESGDGQATKARYIGWFDRFVAPRYKAGGTPSFSGEDCYYYRCSLLHQGRAQHPRSSYERILFLEPNPQLILHNIVFNRAFIIDAGAFCIDVVEGAEFWLAAADQTSEFRANYPKFLQRYPSGLEPYVSGYPVIA